MNLGKNIKNLRTNKNMTQEDLAELLNTTVKSVSRWENSTTYPDISILPLLANIFEVSVDELLDVEKVKMEEYITNLQKQARGFEKNNDLDGEFKVWEEAYKKYPNNEKIAVGYANLMDIVNHMRCQVVYSDEIVKICERILDKSLNHTIRDQALKILVNLYSMQDNIEKADFYAKQLTRNYSCTYDVVKTRYLRGQELLKAIQNNVYQFILELRRESEHVIKNSSYSVNYRIAFLEKMIELREVMYDINNENDFGYDVAGQIFENIDLALLVIRATNDKEKVKTCFNKIKDGLNYILNFEPHKIASALLSTFKCDHLGAHTVVLLDIKTHILKALNGDDFKEYHDTLEFKEIINLVSLLENK